MKSRNILPAALCILALASVATADPFPYDLGIPVARVGATEIGSDYIVMLVKEDLARGSDVDGILDMIIEDTVLIGDAAALDLQGTPQAISRLSKQMEHIRLVAVYKAAHPEMTLGQISDQYNEIYLQRFEACRNRTDITYPAIDPAFEVARTHQAAAERRNIIVARSAAMSLTLQDLLDLFTTDPELQFMEHYLAQGRDLVTRAILRKEIEVEYAALVTAHPVLVEMEQRMQANLMANMVRAHYANPYFGGAIASADLPIAAPAVPEPTAEDLAGYYDTHPKQFVVADWVDARHAVVDGSSQMTAMLEEVQTKRIERKGDVKKLIRDYSVGKDRDRDGDLGRIYNPILHPDEKLPAVVTHGPLAVVDLFRTPKGAHTNPYQTEAGHHVLFVTERNEAVVPLENPWAQETARRGWMIELRRKMLTEKVAQLKAAATVQVDLAVLGDVKMRSQ